MAGRSERFGSKPGGCLLQSQVTGGVPLVGADGVSVRWARRSSCGGSSRRCVNEWWSHSGFVTPLTGVDCSAGTGFVNVTRRGCQRPEVPFPRETSLGEIGYVSGL